MKNKTRNLLTFFLALCLLITVFPVSAFAAETPGNAQVLGSVATKEATKKPSLFVASDSTAKHYEKNVAPKQGWAEYLPKYLKTSVKLKNHAVSACSSRTYISKGYFDSMMKEVKAGDIVLVQFGQNDSIKARPERYTPPCGNIKNPTKDSYEYCIEKMVKAIKKKKATPVLCSPAIRFTSYDKKKKKFIESRPEFRTALKGISKEFDVAYIDLNAIMVKDFNKKSYKTVKSYYYGVTAKNPEPANDRTHFTYDGADHVAKLICSKLDGIVKKAVKK